MEEDLKIDKNIPKICIENKCDLLREEKDYNNNMESLKAISRELGCFCFFRTSALNGYNIKESFESLINQMIKIQEEKERETKRIKAEKIKAKVKSDEEIQTFYCC